MKKLLLAPALLLAAACGLDDFDVTRSATVMVPGAPGGGVIPDTVVRGLAIPLGRDILDDEGADPDDVDSARLRRVRVEARSGASLETWLDEIAVYAEGDGLPRVRLASRTGIRSLAAETRSVDLDVPGQDLKPFLVARTASITSDLAGTAPAVDTELRVTATIRVDVNVSGVLR
jgi:hypothetical protein